VRMGTRWDRNGEVRAAAWPHEDGEEAGRARGMGSGGSGAVTITN
jgi:hypothetical protein